MMQLTFYGGVGTVTGANFLLELEARKILIDCGLLQGSPDDNQANMSFSYDPGAVDLLFITHAHLDHIGKIPLLVKNGFKGKIFSTSATKEIARPMLLDAAKVSRTDRETLYGPEDVARALSLWQTLEYHTPQNFEEFSLRLLDAGHILGSAMLEFGISGKRLVFTGDLGNSPSLLLPDADRVEGADYLVMESVYGDRNHEDEAEREEKLEEAIRGIAAANGTLLIPAFSLERTQTILYVLNKIFESGRVKAIPVFLDSPLAIRVTEIYERIKNLYKDSVRQEFKNDDIFKFLQLRETAQVRDSREIVNVPGPKIILAGSGMSSGGRIVGHEEIYLPDPKTTILFVGYQAPGTLGRLILEGEKQVWINGHKVDVRAKIIRIDGFSGHADSDELVEFVSHSKDSLKKVFVTMGEPRASIFLAQRLRDELEVDAIVPELGKTYELGS